MTLLVIYVLLALGISFACSVMEAALLSVTPSYVAVLERNGKRAAERLKALKQDIDRPLVAILSLNTIAHTVGAAGVGAQAAKVFGEAHLGVVSAVLTLLILVLSEIIPKTWGAVYWRQLAPLVATLSVAVMWGLWPLVRALEALTKLLARQKKTASVSREEMRALADLGVEQGVFAEDESRIMRNLFRFRSLQAKDVMTPRTVMVAVPEAKTVRELLQEYGEIPFSRVPVYKEDLDDVSGYVLKDRILFEAAQGRPDAPLGSLKRDILVFPAVARLPKLFDQMINRRDHMALVVDEYGGTEGILTMEDIVETLLGLEIVDEADSVEDMQAYARKAWAERAQALGLFRGRTGATAPERGAPPHDESDSDVSKRLTEQP